LREKLPINAHKDPSAALPGSDGARIADMATVTLRYWAAAKQAAGIAEETVSADTLGGALAAAADRGSALRAVLARSSFLVDGDPVGRRPPDSVPLRDAAVVEVLPPFAGG
jgi:molybdopterin converting factor small subunit